MAAEGEQARLIARAERLEGRVLPAARFEVTPPRPWVAADGPPPRYNCVLDIRRAAEELGYRPRYWPLEQAVADFLAEAARMERLQPTAAPR